MSPWPGAFARIGGKTIKVHATALTGASPQGATPGEVILADKAHVLVACGPEGREAIALARIQLEGKKPIAAGDWVVGRGVKKGDRFDAR
jgi:methionyl-tRNA formyltransferase